MALEVGRVSAPTPPIPQLSDGIGEITVRGLVVDYEGVPAVKGIDFEVGRGEHVTLLGPSGCGKTSTLRAIAGLERPSAGVISIDGRVVFSSSPKISVPTERRNLSMVFQSYAIWPHMTVFENAVYGLRVRKENKAVVQERGNWALKVVQMEKYADRKASDLSGGQQQRVALARSIAFSPSVVLFDEPLSNLDASLRVEMRSQIQELQDRVGITAVYVTHDQEEALAISDRIIVMNDGVIQQIGTPGEIYDSPRSAFVADFIGSANLVSGRVVRSERGSHMTAVETVPGIVVHGRASGAEEGTTVTLSIRTVYVRLSEQPPAAAINTWPGKVERVTFAGDVIEYRLSWAGGEMLCRRPPTDRMELGDDVFIHVDPEHCVPLAD